MSKTALVLVAQGSEEMEAVITIDVLRRGGIDVTVASISDNDVVKCSRGVNIKADAKLSAIIGNNYDAVVLPGGLDGSKAFQASNLVGEVLRRQEKEGRLVAAICAAPTALKTHGIGSGKKLTSYPNFKEELSQGYTYSEDRVVEDGKLITSRGPGTAFEFALALVNHLVGHDKKSEVEKPLLLK